MVTAGNTNLKGRLSTVELHVLTSTDQLLLIVQTLFTILQNKEEEVNRTEPSPSVSVPWLQFSVAFEIKVRSISD
jgi:hypothetical protein